MTTNNNEFTGINKDIEISEENTVINNEVNKNENLNTNLIKEVSLSSEQNLTNEESSETISDVKLFERIVEPLENHDLQAEITQTNQEIEPLEKIEEENYLNLSRESLVKILEEVVLEENINTVKSKVSSIKVAFWKLDKEIKQQEFLKFISEGGIKEDYKAVIDEVEENYNKAFNIYKTKRKKFIEDEERLKLDNLGKKLKLIEDLKELINSEETLKKTYDDFKAIQEKWKEIGQVPSAEINNLWQNYHFLVEKFFDKIKINKELKDLDLKKNIERQLELCEKAEELLLEPSITKSFKQLQQYHDEWKEIGPVPIEKKDELWERFKNATDRINQSRRDYYISLHDEQQKNYSVKQELCDQLEQILTIQYTNPKEWKDASDKINELQKVWKTIGYTSKKFNNDIWERFRNGINSFYLAKSEFFKKVKEEQLNNFNQKVNICLRAEALKESQDWKKTTSEFIALQNEWKNIGTVPAKHSESIWKRFRTACDIFFKNKSEFFSNIDKNQDDNLKLKMTLIEKIESFVPTDDQNETLMILKEYQKEWTNIGYVASDKKDDLYNKFKSAINQQFEKIKSKSTDKVDLRYKSKFDNIVDTPYAEKSISKEISFLNGKITNLKTDINLWETNIELFAKSKNADLLKQEYYNKILQAKKSIEEMQEKIKFLLDTKNNVKS